jgi:hypothetical protein
MAAESGVTAETWNYFNYFTEVEEHFQKARGTALFLLSPLDWALVETWKNADVPLEAVLRGIDEAFEKWRNKKVKHRQVNSLAYCAQEVAEHARIMAGGAAAVRPKRAEAPFPLEDLQAYLQRNAESVRDRGPKYEEIASSLETLTTEAAEQYRNLEALEQRLTVLEEKMSAIARSSQSEETLLAARRDLDATLRPYRGKMTADQIAMLERQYLERRLLENEKLPRLSLFYLR